MAYESGISYGCFTLARHCRILQVGRHAVVPLNSYGVFCRQNETFRGVAEIIFSQVDIVRGMPRIAVVESLNKSQET